MGHNYSNKNLTELEIGNIEFYLNENKSPAEIAKILSKDSSGIRKEIKKYSSNYGNKGNAQIVLIKITFIKNIYVIVSLIKQNILNVNTALMLSRYVLTIRLILNVNY